jgi:hypothetical protein
MNTKGPHSAHAGAAGLPCGRFEDVLLIAAILLSAYALTFSGLPRVEDEQLIGARAQSLVLWGDLSFTQLSGNERIRHLALTDPVLADLHAAVEPGGSVLASLFYRAGAGLGLGGAQASTLSNAYLTALTGVMVYLTVIQMGYRTRTAAVAALAFGLGTMAWPYAKTLFRDGLLMASTAAVMLGLVLALSRQGKGRWAGWSLVAVGLAVGILTKRTAWALVPGVALAVMVQAWPGLPRGRRRWGWIAAGLAAGGLALAVLWLIPPLGPLARLSTRHFAYAAGVMLKGIGLETLVATLGPFLSPGKSIFISSPVLLLAPVGMFLGWKRHRSFFIFAISSTLLLALAQALFYGEMWAGIPVWGLRYMLLALPLLTVLCAPLFEAILGSTSWLPKSGAALLAGLSLLVQIAGAAVSWAYPIIAWTRAGFDPFPPAWPWDVHSSPVPVHLAALRNGREIDLAWARVLEYDAQALVIPLGCAAIFLLGMVLLYMAIREVALSPAFKGLVIAAGITALIFPLLPNLYLLRGDPALGGDQPTYGEAVAWTAAQARPDDLVIVDSYGTPLWQFMLNRWRGAARWYSLPYRSAGESSAAGAALTGEILAAAPEPGTVWVISAGHAPGEGTAAGTSFSVPSFELAGMRAFDGVRVMRWGR